MFFLQSIRIFKNFEKESFSVNNSKNFTHQVLKIENQLNVHR